MLGPASGIKVNSLSYHLINSDDIHHHAVPLWIYLDRDSARQLRCWGVCRSNVLALSPEPKRWRLPLSFGQTVCRAPQASALADMYHVHYVDYPPYVHLPIDRIPGHTFPEHPNILYTSFSAYEEVQYRTSPFHTSLACSSGQAPRPTGRALFCYLIPKRSMLLTTCTRVGDHLHTAYRDPLKISYHHRRRHRVPLTMSSEYHDKSASLVSRDPAVFSMHHLIHLHTSS
jgi:hypothetical protein